MPYTPNNPYIPGDPYSYNLNWIVKELKKAIALYSPLSADFEDLKNYVMDYFANLDLTTEVRNIINTMTASGYFEDLIRSIMLDDNELQNAVSAWLTANVDPVGSAVTVDASLTIAGSAADASATGSAVESLSSLLNSISIEGYAKNNVLISGTQHNGEIFTTTGSIVAVSNWAYVEYNVEPMTDYLVSGTTATMARLYLILDSSNNIITMDTAGSDTYVTDKAVRTPFDAAKMIVNIHTTQGAASLKKAVATDFSLISSSVMGEEIAPDYWQIACDNDVSYEVSLYGSKNGAFNYEYLKRYGSTLKNVADDITPIYLLGTGYVGANHGYNIMYTVDSTAHGLTTADIGKTCVVDGNTWLLINVTGINTFNVVCLEPGNWWGTKNITPLPTAFSFAGGTQTVNTITLGQMYPSVKNIDVSVIENSSNHFIIAECYDIIDPSGGFNWLQSHIGTAEYSDIVSQADGALRVRNVYDFTPSGNVKLSQSIKLLKNIGVYFYGASQSAAFTNNDYYCIPETAADTLTAAGVLTYFDRSTWDDPAIPPELYIQANGTPATANAMMIQDVYCEDRNSNIISQAGFISALRKMYPYAIQPSGSPGVNTVFSFSVNRLLAFKGTNGDNFASFFSNASGDYVVIYATASGSFEISVPVNMIGKRCTLEKASNITLKSDIASSSIAYTASAEGYALIKLG